eukprot:jgi/Botrbrau1/10917/Bobra.0025s0090.1
MNHSLPTFLFLLPVPFPIFLTSGLSLFSIFLPRGLWPQPRPPTSSGSCFGVDCAGGGGELGPVRSWHHCVYLSPCVLMKSCMSCISANCREDG